MARVLALVGLGAASFVTLSCAAPMNRSMRTEDAVTLAAQVGQAYGLDKERRCADLCEQKDVTSFSTGFEGAAGITLGKHFGLSGGGIVGTGLLGAFVMATVQNDHVAGAVGSDLLLSAGAAPFVGIDVRPLGTRQFGVSAYWRLFRSLPDRPDDDEPDPSYLSPGYDVGGSLRYGPRPWIDVLVSGSYYRNDELNVQFETLEGTSDARSWLTLTVGVRFHLHYPPSDGGRGAEGPVWPEPSGHSPGPPGQ